MSNKSEIIFVEHILESINAIESFIKNTTKEELFKSRLKQSAIIREIEIIGEAVKNLPENLKNKYKKVEWKEISGTRDKMIHHYFGVDLEIIWEIIKHGLPTLKKQIAEIKRDLNKSKA